MMLRYQHVTDTMRRDIAKRLGAHLWDSDDAADDGPSRVNEP
jgi:hypothetical protein